MIIMITSRNFKKQLDKFHPEKQYWREIWTRYQDPVPNKRAGFFIIADKEVVEDFIPIHIKNDYVYDRAFALSVGSGLIISIFYEQDFLNRSYGFREGESGEDLRRFT